MISILAVIVLLVGACQSQVSAPPTAAPTEAVKQLTATPVPAATAKPTTAPATATPRPATATAATAATATPRPAATPSPAPASKSPIKIGILAPFTGPMGIYGESIKNGMSLALDETNWEVAGRKIEIAVEDTKGEPATGLTKAKKLVEKDNANLLAGIIVTSVAYAIRDYVVESKTPLVLTGAVSAKGITMDPKIRSDYILRTSFSTIHTSGALAAFAYKMGYRKAILTAFDYSAGQELTDEFTGIFTKLGGSIVQKEMVPMETVDFAPYLAKLKANDADMLFQFFPGAQAQRFIMQADEYGIKKKLPFFFHAFDPVPATIQAMGDAGINTYGSWPWAEPLDTPENKKFLAAYKAKYGDANPYAAGTYTGGRAIVMALQQVGGNIEDKPAFLAALKKADFAAPGGRFRFDEYGNPIETVYLVNIEKVNGKLGLVIKDKIPDVHQYWTP